MSIRCLLVPATTLLLAACAPIRPTVTHPHNVRAEIACRAHPFAGGRPIIEVKIGNEVTRALADTGSTRTVLRITDEDFHSTALKGWGRERIGTDQGSIDAIQSSIEINGCRFPCFLVAESDAKWGEGFSLLLGLDVLTRYSVVFNYRQARTEFAPPDKHRPTQVENPRLLVLKTENQEMLVVFDTGAVTSRILCGEPTSEFPPDILPAEGNGSIRLERIDSLELSTALSTSGRKVILLGIRDQHRWLDNVSIVTGIGILRSER